MSKYYYYQTTYGLHIYQPFIRITVKLGFLTSSMKHMVKNTVFGPLRLQELKCQLWKYHGLNIIDAS